MSKFIFIFYFLFFNNQVYSSEIEFAKPKSFEFISNAPETFKNVWKMSFNKKAIPTWITIITSSTVLYIYDEEMMAEVQRWGRSLGLGNDDHTKTLVKVGKVNILRGPTDIGSLMYFIGDGWTHMSIAASFAIYGSFQNNNRAMQTGSQIFHGMITSTIINQIAKRSFGRESPYRASKPRGAWKPFPSITKYNTDTSKYDAMPSGHVMTATMTYTIISNNYPEYRKWTKPIGITLISLLGLQMMNNSVHWISDYPLGIGMGYVFGEVVSNYGKKNKSLIKGHSKTSLIILPNYQRIANNRRYGLFAKYSF